jgi:hypothetical protein
MPRWKQPTARATLHKCLDGDATAGSIPRSVSQGEPRKVADDGVVATEQAARAEGGDTSRGHPSAKEIGNGSSSQSRQENNRQETDTEGAGSQYVSTLAGNCHSGKFYIGAVGPHPDSDVRGHRRCQCRCTTPPVAASQGSG